MTEPSQKSRVNACVIYFLIALQSPSHVQSFNVDGVRREALVVDGTGPIPAGGRPLVIYFHGHGGNMRFSSRLELSKYWPEATIVYPQGLPTKGMTDPQGTKNGWQQKAGDEGDRDIKFVDTMLSSFRGINRRRIYSMGHSNGGRFTYVLWETRGNVFSAYGPSGSPATFGVNSYRPASFFATAGETDPIVPYRVQKASIEALIKLDGIDLSKATKNGYVTLAPGRSGLEMGTYIHPGGHNFPAEAAQATVELFKRH